MRVRHLMVACLALAACQKGSKNEPPVATPTRSDKLVRAAEPVPGSYLVAMADGLGEADAVALAGRHGATLTGYLPAPVNAALVTIDPSKAIALAEDAAVKLAEEDQPSHRVHRVEPRPHRPAGYGWGWKLLARDHGRWRERVRPGHGRLATHSS
jgi:hypothetical protein